MRSMSRKKALVLLALSGVVVLPLIAQTAAEWQQDVDTLAALIEKHHPKPWERISKESFDQLKEQIKSRLPEWNAEKITVELMRLVSSLKDGHTEIRLGRQDGFNLWFPVRMEKFHDGIFITAAAEPHAASLGAKVLNMGGLEAMEAYRRVAVLAARDSETASSRLAANLLPNAVILKTLGIIRDEKILELRILTTDGREKTVSLLSAAWPWRNNWTWNKTAVPTNDKVKTIYDSHMKELPLYLLRMIPQRIPYWFEHVPEKKLLYFQFNQVADWSQNPFADFTKKLFRTYDENRATIDKFVIDLRFNEGGNGYLLPPFVQEFILRRDSLKPGSLYIITGDHTFSAAPNLIGQMKKQTSAITVGEIAPGPLNWCSDIMEFALPHSQLRVNISTMFWMTGHALDKRGYYPPDYYLPLAFKDFISFTDKPLEAIMENRAVPLKDILLKEGWDKFNVEFEKRKALYLQSEPWFPYTSFDLVMMAYFDLAPAGKKADALEVLKLNTRLYPEEFRSWYALAEIGNELENIDLALPAYEKLLALEPQLADIQNSYYGLQLLKAFNAKGKQGLTGMFKELHESHPSLVNENALNVLGYRKFNQNKIAEALEIFRLNVDLHPGFANGYDSLGEAYLKAGDKEKAIRAYQKALELDPELGSAKSALEKLGANRRGS